MIRALIFDFDGLILDTEGPIFQSWQEIYQSFGCHLSFSDWATILGTTEGSFDPFDELEAQLGKAVDRRALDSRQRQREHDLILSQPIRPGVQDYLEGARLLGLKIGLASSSSCQWVSGHLERLGLLDYFDCIRASDDVAHTKPNPELYRAVLAELDLLPEQAVVFEDSPNGVLAAKRAGIYCVAVPNPLTRLLSLDHADIHLDSMAELPLEDLLERISPRDKAPQKER